MRTMAEDQAQGKQIVVHVQGTSSHLMQGDVTLPFGGTDALPALLSEGWTVVSVHVLPVFYVTNKQQIEGYVVLTRPER